jgi:hypothetical protein
MVQVYGLPTLLYLRGGEIVYRTEGALPAEAIMQVRHYCCAAALMPDDVLSSLLAVQKKCAPKSMPRPFINRETAN